MLMHVHAVEGVGGGGLMLQCGIQFIYFTQYQMYSRGNINFEETC